jgi:hypothetical protein
MKDQITAITTASTVAALMMLVPAPTRQVCIEQVKMTGYQLT